MTTTTLEKIEAARVRFEKRISELAGTEVDVSITAHDANDACTRLAADAIRLGWIVNHSKRELGAWISSPFGPGAHTGNTTIWFARP